MEKRGIGKGVFWMGAVDWDRRLFDALIPLPDGTSYNAYLVEGSEKTALLDAVDPAMADAIMSQLEDVRRVDYLVSHHAEQDHSGAVPAILAKYPECRLVCSTTAKDMLLDLLDVPAERIGTVEDGEMLSLGDRTLKFIHTPWVHWPETMVSYLPEERILFSCDFFGSHIAASDVFVTEKERVLEAAKRYYAEIMMPFRPAIATNLSKLEGCDIGMIAPSHGQVYREPGLILDAYREWVGAEPGNLVVIPYVTMHESTRRMVDYLAAALARRDVGVKVFDMTASDIGKLAMALVDARTIIFGTPTVLGGPHPVIASVAFLTNALKPKAKQFGVIGSFGWGSRAPEVLASTMRSSGIEALEPVLVQGLPRSDACGELDALADLIRSRHKPG